MTDSNQLALVFSNLGRKKIQADSARGKVWIRGSLSWDYIALELMTTIKPDMQQLLRKHRRCFPYCKPVLPL